MCLVTVPDQETGPIASWMETGVKKDQLQEGTLEKDSYIVSIAKPTGLGFEIMPLVFSRAWWVKSLAFIWLFRKQSFKAALLMAIGSTIYFIALCYFFLTFGMNATINGVGEAVWKFGSCLLVLFVGGLGGFFCIMWSLAQWLVLLTGFSRSYLLYETPLARDSSLADFQKSCVLHFRTRKSFLVTTWLVFSVVSLIPFIWLIISSVVYVAAVSFSREQVAFAVVTGVIAMLLMSNYTLMVFPLSSVSNKSGRQVAVESLVWSLRVFPILTVVSVITMVLNHLVGSPVALVGLNPFLCIPTLFFTTMCTIIVFPIGVIVPCELLRSAVVLEKKHASQSADDFSDPDDDEVGKRL